jgi:hypothetical protein
MAGKERLIFSSVVYATEFSETAAVLLAESIRDFAGALSKVPIRYVVTDYGKKLSLPTRQKLQRLGVELMPFKMDPETAKFPFAAYVNAAEFAEIEARENTEVLAWLASNTIMLKEPRDFKLNPKVILGYRPVHHTLIGSRFSKPLDLFWTLVYEYCAVPEERIFPMTAHIDGVEIRPYFNAGFLITRPERQLFQTWRSVFFDVYQKPDFQEFYAKDERYAIFVHQAILSGVVLASLRIGELLELPPDYNYPLHLYGEDVTANRPGSMDELITARHEGLKDPDWMKNMPMGKELRGWLTQMLCCD